MCVIFFFFNDTATTEIYTLSLHDALPISPGECPSPLPDDCGGDLAPDGRPRQDRKSTRLNSSHSQISYAVFCLKKKNRTIGYNHCRAVHTKGSILQYNINSDTHATEITMT